MDTLVYNWLYRITPGANMLETVTAYIERHQLLPANGEILIGVSGGADSLCLLHLLHQLCGPGKRYSEVRLHAAHLNHKLRAEAGDFDAAVVANLVISWGIPITLGEVDVPALARQERRSLEDAARAARYRFLREVARGQPIAVAHHADDQVETLLLHWLRGSGLAGIVGMLPRSQDIIRPLLEVTHAETVAYCQQHNIAPLEDVSNIDPRFVRNRIRHQLLPILVSLNPGIRSTLLRNAESMRIDLAGIEAQVDACWPGIVTSEQQDTIKLKRSAFEILPQSLQRHLLRRVTAKLCAGQSPLELRHYTLIEQLLQDKDDRNIGAGVARPAPVYRPQKRVLHLPGQLQVTCDLKNLVVERHQLRRQQFLFSSSDTEIQLPIPGSVEIVGTPWTATAELLPGELVQNVQRALQNRDWSEVWRLLPLTRHTVYVDGDVIGTHIVVRTRHPGDRIQPLGMKSEKKVQDVLVDHHIPRADRAHIPLFFSTEHCLWLAGICLDDRARLTGKTQHIVRLSINQTPKVGEQSTASLYETTQEPPVGARFIAPPFIAPKLRSEGNMHDDIDEILITENEIRAKVAVLGERITNDYRGKNLVLLGTLKGAVPFIGDLARTIDLPLEIDYMAISSYGNSTSSSGVVRILKDLEGPIDQKHVLIVEDIVDSGLTLHYLTDVLKQRRPLSLRICTLLDKGRERTKAVQLDYIGFRIPDRFVVGYGLDYAQRYRNLPYIGVLKPSIYEEVSEKPQAYHKSPAENSDNP